MSARVVDLQDPRVRVLLASLRAGLATLAAVLAYFYGPLSSVESMLIGALVCFVGPITVLR